MTMFWYWDNLIIFLLDQYPQNGVLLGCDAKRHHVFFMKILILYNLMASKIKNKTFFSNFSYTIPLIFVTWTCPGSCVALHFIACIFINIYNSLFQPIIYYYLICRVNLYKIWFPLMITVFPFSSVVYFWIGDLNTL